MSGFGRSRGIAQPLVETVQDSSIDERCGAGLSDHRLRGLADRLNLPDPDDRHVVAAAIRCQAAVIVTSNVKDFPKEILDPLG